MKKFLLANSTNKLEYASILAGEAWLSGILERSHNTYLDLIEPSEDQCVTFLTCFVENCSQLLYTQDEVAKRYGKKVDVIVSHIDENTSSEVIADAARKANINLKNIPTYSYTKFYIQKDTIWVDINTTDENKRTAYSITQNGNRNFDVQKYEPDHGVDLADFIANIQPKEFIL